MNYDDRERLIALISFGQLFVDENYNGNAIQLVIRQPTVQDQAKAALVYKKSYQLAIINGMMTNKQLLDHLILSGDWNKQTDEQIDGLKQDIQNIVKGLLSLLFHPNKLEITRQALRKAEQALADRLKFKNNLLSNSAENYALLQQQKYTLSKIVYTIDEKLFWPSDQAFDSFEDLGLINRLLSTFFLQSHMQLHTIRLLARSNPWRQTWSIAKTIGTVFDQLPQQWSYNQRELVHWSCVYDMAFEAYERPTKEIVDDDDLFDSWLMNQADKIEKKAKEDMGDKVIKNLPKDGRQECFIMTDSEGAKRVYDFNNPISRSTVRARQKVIGQRGIVKEQDMPDSQQIMRQKLMQMRQDKIGRRTKR